MPRAAGCDEACKTHDRNREGGSNGDRVSIGSAKKRPTREKTADKSWAGDPVGGTREGNVIKPENKRKRQTLSAKEPDPSIPKRAAGVVSKLFELTQRPFCSASGRPPFDRWSSIAGRRLADGALWPYARCFGSWRIRELKAAGWCYRGGK
uniref:Uncharacterized protein n=1 Tax=Panagrellus redivivus TaxID=6233 RepID=A0A7E4VQK0_PANRE